MGAASGPAGSKRSGFGVTDADHVGAEPQQPPTTLQLHLRPVQADQVTYPVEVVIGEL